MGSGTAYHSQSLGLSILQSALYKLNMMPIQEVETVEAFEKHFQHLYFLILDVTKQRTERPSDYETQKNNYNKKSTRKKYSI
jgi:hypothetical protein